VDEAKEEYSFDFSRIRESTQDGMTGGKGKNRAKEA